MEIFTIPAEKWNEGAPDKNIILQLIRRHRAESAKLQKLKRYYAGLHKILEDKDKENKLVCNHAKDIADTASSYFIGNPVSYNSKQDITAITDALNAAGADETDGDNGLDLSIYGRAYEYIYTREGDTELEIKNLQPENTFMVYDETIEQRELFAVYYYAKKDDSQEGKVEYAATVLGKKYKWEMSVLDTENGQTVTEKPEEHFKGEVPVIEYLNNKLAIGDYQLQIPLIDAYNVLMSDRVTDKEQFIDAILALYGALLSDEDSGEGDKKGTREAMATLKKEKLVELPADSRAEYLTRTFDEAGVEILKKAIEQDIHKFSHIPCMTDDNFGGNVSGVAMEFKLLGLENLTKIKTRYYKKGLRKRLRIFANFLSTRSGVRVDVSTINPIFTRAMPKNLLEISQYVANLWGKVSKKTLLAQIPFVEDVEEEVKAVEKEEKEGIERQKALFGNQGNEPLDLEDDEPEE